MTVEIRREQALAYRVAAQGLAREATAAADLDVLALGVQDTTVGSARVALAARLPDPPAGDPLDDPALTLLWSVRGAPHVHRTADLPGLVAALWPTGDADARARLAAERKPLDAAGVGALEALLTAARALRAVVTGPMPKGEASAGVTARLPPSYAYACRSCGTTHVYGGLFQLAAPFAGVRLLPGRSPATLAPLDPRPPLPPEATGPGELARAYLRLHGPAGPAEAASYLGTNQTALRPSWPDGLVEVRLEGRRAWVPAERLDTLREAGAPGDLVRLLPPSDPYLQARDRDLLVPGRDRQKAVWRILGNPGAVLAGTEVVGTWRARAAGKRLDVTVQPFDGLRQAVRRALPAEAERVATVRGSADVRLAYEEA